MMIKNQDLLFGPCGSSSIPSHNIMQLLNKLHMHMQIKVLEYLEQLNTSQVPEFFQLVAQSWVAE